MPLKIITDSTSDITLTRGKELGIEILPLKVRFDGVEYADGVDITHAQFYAKMRSSKDLPVTSQVNPAEFVAAFEQANGEDILVITLASQISGTYQSACIAKEQLERENIYIVDSGSAAIGEASLVLAAVEMRNNGHSAQEIRDRLEEIKGKITLMLAIDNLTYLQKGGRLSTAGAMLGGLLSIKPVVEVKRGELGVISKARGFKNALSWIVEEAKRRGVDGQFPIAFAHSDSEALCLEFAKAATEQLKGSDQFQQQIGVVLGTHTGPGCVALMFYEK